MGKREAMDLHGFKVLVCGGRDFDDVNAFTVAMNKIDADTPITMVIEGGCPRGADRLARQWAHARGIHVATVEALWKLGGTRAGPMRNAAMLTLMPQLVVAFPGGRGTAGMIEMAKRAAVPVMEPLRVRHADLMEALLEANDSATERTGEDEHDDEGNGDEGEDG